MIKLLKNLFLICLILLFVGGIWGHQNGITKDNYKEVISEFISNYQQKASSPEIQEQLGTRKVAPKSDVNTETIKKEHSTSVAKEEEKYELLSLPKNPFYAIDQHARNAPASAEIDIPSLANYLKQNAQLDIAKARAIYVWMTHNIRYDDQAFNSGNYPDYTPKYVLENRKAVCDGYSRLFRTLGIAMGLEIEKVVGYSKGYGYRVGQKISKTDHAWNIIKINGQWKVFDATWGSGHGKNVNGRLVSTQEFDNYWFNLSPYEAIFNHYPENPDYSFVQPPISLRQYEQMAKIDAAYFEFGFNGKETFLEAKNNPNFKAPTVYNADTYVSLETGPKFKTLSINEAYNFEFYIPRAYKVAVIDSRNKWTYFEREKGKFKINYTPKQTGKLSISVLHEKSGKSYETIVGYDVKSDRQPI